MIKLSNIVYHIPRDMGTKTPPYMHRDVLANMRKTNGPCNDPHGANYGQENWEWGNAL